MLLCRRRSKSESQPNKTKDEGAFNTTQKTRGCHAIYWPNNKVRICQVLSIAQSKKKKTGRNLLLRLKPLWGQKVKNLNIAHSFTNHQELSIDMHNITARSSTSVCERLKNKNERKGKNWPWWSSWTKTKKSKTCIKLNQFLRLLPHSA